MIYTDIVGNTLVAYGEHLDGEIPVEIAPKGLDSKSVQAFLLDRKLSRQMTGYTIVEQVLLTEGNYKPKQW